MRYITTTFFAIFTFISTFTQAQEMKDLLGPTETPIYWLGIDFSQVKIIGDFNQFAEWGKVTTREIRNEYFPAWNDLVYKEPKKYNVADAFRKEQIIFWTDPVYARNKMAAIENMETRTEPEYTPELLESIVKSHDFAKKEGIGILLIADCMNKFKSYAKYHLVVIRMKDNAILHHQFYTCEAGGIGVKLYWAKTIQSVFQSITNKDFLNWKEQYSL